MTSYIQFGEWENAGAEAVDYIIIIVFIKLGLKRDKTVEELDILRFLFFHDSAVELFGIVGVQFLFRQFTLDENRAEILHAVAVADKLFCP